MYSTITSVMCPGFISQAGLPEEETEMHVMVFGSESQWALGRMCARGFASLGHRTTYFGFGTRTVPVLGLALGKKDVRDSLVEKCRRSVPNLVLVIKGEEIDASTVRRVREVGECPVVNWNPDNPFQNRSSERRMHTYLEALEAYDAVFIWSRELFTPLYDEGAREVYHLPFAYDQDIHYPTDPSPKFETDVIFLGHWSEKRQRHMAALADADLELSIYGNYWGRKCFNRKVRRCVRGSAVFGDAYCRAMCSGKVVVNVVADHNLDAYNMRAFEIPATGSFMATTRTEGQQKLFGEGEGMVCFDSPKELREQAEHYLEHTSEREQIAAIGAQRVEPHTYEQRIQTVISRLESIVNA